MAQDTQEASEEARPAWTSNAEVIPYIEVNQLLVADLNGGGEVLTYTSVAAGVSAGITTRRFEAQSDVRYERRISWDDDLADNDIVSGLVRARADVVPGNLSLEGGALATRSRGDISGAAPGVLVGNTDNTVDVYSVYAGPNVSIPVGEATVTAAYRIGYNRVDTDDAVVTAGGVPVQPYDDSTNHLASVSVGIQPGPLPVGLASGGSYEREDSSILDQRYERKAIRTDVTVPVSPTLAVVGGVGYEDLEISQRDVPRDALNAPVVDTRGRFVTDPASPRRLTFQTEGLIYDAGVLWRPSRRTSLEARAGRRYGDFFFSAAYQQQVDRRTNFAFGAYQNFSSYGRRLTGALAGLPTRFDSIRNPLDGSLNSCVFGADNQGTGGCLDSALAGTSTANFIARGAAGQISMNRGRWNYGFGFGFDQRRFKGENLIGVNLDGVTDETYYANLSAGMQIDQQSSLDLLGYVRYFDNQFGPASDILSYGATAAYSRQFVPGLTGYAAAGINGFSRDATRDELIASALLGARYSF